MLGQTVSDPAVICSQMMRDGLRPEEAGPFVFGGELWDKMMEIRLEKRRQKRPAISPEADPP